MYATKQANRFEALVIPVSHFGNWLYVLCELDARNDLFARVLSVTLKYVRPLALLRLAGNNACNGLVAI